ncbi:MAG: DEAD/DEAH box helicase [Sulfolobales archaeon]
MSSSFRNVEEFNIPETILEGIKSKGIKWFTPPQADALNAGLLKWRNVLVVAPTASGKTLIGEIALLNAVLNDGIGIYTTPLKALATEKFEEFKSWRNYGVKIGISTGDYDESGESLGKYDILVTTYEKLDSILRHRPEWINRVKTLVVDELHNVGDSDRGPILELICARVLLLGAQIIGLSATIGNPEAIAKWLNAELVLSDWRPVKLIEGFYDRKRNVIEFNDGRLEVVDTDIITHCVKQALDEDYQLLIFKQSRKQAETTAYKLAELVKGAIKADPSYLVDIIKSESPSRSEAESLIKLISYGVSYHHAGLSAIARKVIEEGFRDGVIKVVVATPTLAAGINVPARRVLVYTRRFENGFMKPISIMEYKQMGGRAGRPQFDPYGEVILVDVASPAEGRKYIYGKVEGVTSALTSMRALRIHLLASIASGYLRSDKELDKFFSKTLAFNTPAFVVSRLSIGKVIEELASMNMLEYEDGEYRPTELGVAVSSLYIDPLTAKIIIKYLDGVGDVKDIYYLHLISMTPDFSRTRITGYNRLEDDALSLSDLGLIPDFSIVKEIDYDDWLRGFKMASILSEWVNEVDEDTIIKKYDIGLGDLLTMTDTGSWIAHAASVVCRVVNLRNHARNLELLSKRIEVGVKEDVLELTQVKGVGRVRARILFESGFRNLRDLANADPKRLANLPTFGEKLAHDIVNQAKGLLTSLT